MTGSFTTPTRRMRAGSTVYGACTSGWIAHREAATRNAPPMRRSTGSGATTSTTLADPSASSAHAEPVREGAEPKGPPLPAVTTRVPYGLLIAHCRDLARCNRVAQFGVDVA